MKRRTLIQAAPGLLALPALGLAGWSATRDARAFGDPLLALQARYAARH